MRLFIAADLPSSVRAHLARIQGRLRQTIPERVTWTRPEQFHMTLRFLGEQDPATTRKVAAFLGALLRLPRVPVRGVGSGLLPERGARRVVAAFYTPLVTDLRVLQTVEDACVAAGLEREKRLPVLHVTLGRLRPPRRMDERPVTTATSELFPGPEFLLDGITLFESILKPGGAEHRKVAGFPVGAPPENL